MSLRDDVVRSGRSPGYRMNAEDEAQVIHLYVNRGLSSKEVARQLGTTHPTVTAIVRRHGFEVRNTARQRELTRAQRRAEVIDMVIELERQRLIERGIDADEAIARAKEVIEENLATEDD